MIRSESNEISAGIERRGELIEAGEKEEGVH